MNPVKTRPATRQGAVPVHPRMVPVPLIAFGAVGPGDERTAVCARAAVLILTCAVAGQAGGVVWMVQSPGQGTLPVPGAGDKAGLRIAWQRGEDSAAVRLRNNSGVELVGLQVDGLMPYAALPAAE